MTTELTSSDPATATFGAAPPHVWRILLPVLLAMALSMVDQTMIAAALPLVAQSLGQPERVRWVLIGYMMANMVAAPVYGGLGDRFRRRNVLLAALAIFILGALLCVVAPTLELLIAARILQGIGGGGLMTSAQAILGESVPVRDRPRYQGYLGAVAISCASAGPVLGGMIGDLLGWRAIFVATLPITLMTVVLAFALPEPDRAALPSRDKPWRFDTWGLAWFAGLAVALLMALEQVKQVDPAAAIGIAACVALAVVFLVALIRRERRVPDPLLPLDLLAEAPLRYSNLLVLLHGCVLVGLISLLPIYLRVEQGMSATNSGIVLLLLTGGLAVGALLGGRLVTRTRRTTIFPAIGMTVTTAILLLVVVGLDRVVIWQIGLAVAVVGLMMGSTMGVAQLVVQIASGPRAIGVTAGFLQFSRSLGSAFGVSLGLVALFAAMRLIDPAALMLFEARLAGVAANEAAEAAVLRAFQAAIGTLTFMAFLGAVVAWRHPMRRY